MEISERGARFLLGLLAVLSLAALLLVRPYLSYVLLALITAYLLRTPRTWLAARASPRIAASVLVGATLVVLVAPLVALATLLLDELQRLATLVASGELAGRMGAILVRNGAGAQSAAQAVDALVQGLEGFASRALSQVVPGAIELFVGLFVFFFVLFYALLEGHRWVAFVREAVPLRARRMDRLLDECGRALDAVFRGEILVALVQGLAATLGWWLFGYPNPLLWGSVMTLLSIIPWTGAPLVIVPAGIWSIAEGDVVRGVLFILFGVALVGSIDNVLRPLVIGRSGQIHPALVLVGVVGGLTTFGLVGLFLGPLVLTLLRAVVVVWIEAEPAG